MELSKLFLFYIFIILVIYFIKPSIFQLNNLPENQKRRKFILILLFMFIVAIIIFFFKIFYEYYLTN
jgi:hypothetical protein